MELFLLTRGKSDEVEQWAKWVSTRHLPLPIKNADGTSETFLMECQLRPIQLWGFVFPKESLDIVLNTFGLPNGNPSEFKNGKYVAKFDNKLWALRKLLGAKEIPTPKKDAGVLFMPYDRFKHVSILGVGLREDGEIAEKVHERI